MSAYASQSEANVYFANRLNVEAWTDNESSQATALEHATLIIDRLNFLGKKTDDDQTNQFPRYDDTEVPQDIKYACCEIALALLDGVDPELEYENQMMVTQGYSNIKSTYDRSRVASHIVAGVPSRAAWLYLLPYLRDPRAIDIYRVS